MDFAAANDDDDDDPAATATTMCLGEIAADARSAPWAPTASTDPVATAASKMAAVTAEQVPAAASPASPKPSADPAASAPVSPTSLFELDPVAARKAARRERTAAGVRFASTVPQLFTVRRYDVDAPPLVISPQYRRQSLGRLMLQPRAYREITLATMVRFVVLEWASAANDADELRLRGSIVVRHLGAYEKRVTLRFTNNRWATYHDAQAMWKEQLPESPLLERFTFDVDLTPYFIDSGMLELCVSYTTGGQTYWDNNGHSNYWAQFQLFELTENELRALPELRAAYEAPGGAGNDDDDDDDRSNGSAADGDGGGDGDAASDGPNSALRIGAGAPAATSAAVPRTVPIASGSRNPYAILTSPPATRVPPALAAEPTSAPTTLEDVIAAIRATLFTVKAAPAGPAAAAWRYSNLTPDPDDRKASPLADTAPDPATLAIFSK